MNTLKPQKDPLGQAVKSFFETQQKIIIHVESNIAEDDTLPVDYLFGIKKDLPKLEIEALNICEGKILDIGAAAGRHSLLLQEMKKDVTALEISKLCCEVMTKRGVIHVIEDDYYAYKGAKYDTLLCLMNGIGIAGTIAGIEPFLRRASSLLNPGGKIVFDSSDIDYMYLDNDGSKWVNINSCYYGELEYTMRYNGCQGDTFPWLFIDIETLKPIAQKHGFEARLLVEGDHYDYLGVLYKL